MKYVAAYLLAMAGGDAKPSAEKIKSILEAVGATVVPERLNALLKQFEGKDIEQIIKEGSSKMIITSGGSAPATQQQGSAPQQKVEEKKKEEEAVAAAPLDLGDMFGDW